MRLAYYLLVLLVHQVAWAYEPERATSNLAHEAAECSAYFMVVSTAPTLDAETVAGLRGKFEALLKISVSLSSEKLTKARFELASKGMRKDLDGSWSNLSVVNNRYGYGCMDLAKDPEARYRYWLDKND